MHALSPADTAPAPAAWTDWAAALAAAEVEHRPLPAGASVLAVGAHPDDETIGAGRLVADHDGPVRCVTLTAGEACFGADADPDDVRAVRLAEWSVALTHLGATALGSPRWPDGRLADFEAAAAAALAGLAAGADVLLAPWRHDPHPDHGAAGRIAAAAARRLGVPLREYLVWTPYWLAPVEVAALGASVHRCPTSASAEVSWRRAVDCFDSQVRPRPPARAAVVPPELLRRHGAQLLVGA